MEDIDISYGDLKKTVVEKALFLILIIVFLIQFSFFTNAISQTVEIWPIVYSKDNDAANGIKLSQKSNWSASNNFFVYGNLYFRISNTLSKINPLDKSYIDNYQFSEDSDKIHHFSLMIISLFSIYGMSFLLSFLITKDINKILVSIILINTIFMSNKYWVSKIFGVHPDLLLCFFSSLGIFFSIKFLSFLDQNNIEIMKIKNNFLILSAISWGLALSVKPSALFFIPALFVLFLPLKKIEIQKRIIDYIKFLSRRSERSAPSCDWTLPSSRRSNSSPASAPSWMPAPGRSSSEDIASGRCSARGCTSPSRCPNRWPCSSASATACSTRCRRKPSAARKTASITGCGRSCQASAIGLQPASRSAPENNQVATDHSDPLQPDYSLEQSVKPVEGIRTRYATCAVNTERTSMKPFLEAIREQVLILDGAMGTMLQERGLKPGQSPEELNLTMPQVVASVHRDYLEAGADIIITNTFGGTRFKLAHYGLEDRLVEINARAVEIARSEARGRAYVGASIGPTGQFVEPLGEVSFDEMKNAFREQAQALVDAGADLISLETFLDIKECRAAVIGIREVSASIPVIAMLTFDDNGRSVLGTSPEAAAITLTAAGADIVGSNCGLGVDGIYDILCRMRKVTGLPLISQANAGLPQLIDGKTIFPGTPDEMTAYHERMIGLGVRVIGGCCGTTPAHIRAMKDALAVISRPGRRGPKRPVIPCSPAAPAGVRSVATTKPPLSANGSIPPVKNCIPRNCMTARWPISVARPWNRSRWAPPCWT